MSIRQLIIVGCLVLGFAIQSQAANDWRQRVATTCNTLTDGKYADLCHQTSDNTLWRCDPTGGLSGTCDTTGEWVSVGGGSSTQWTTSGNNLYSNVSGNVGIGTPTPTSKLTITGGSIEVQGTTGDPYYLSSPNGIRLDGGHTAFTTAGMTVATNNNVGVGTITPNSNLEVVSTGSLAIPRGTSVTASSAGQIGIDTTDDQFNYYGSSRRILPYRSQFCWTLESPTSGDDDIPVFSPVSAITVTGVYCRVQGGTSAGITISDGSNALEEVVCDADGQADDGTIQNPNFTANERMEFDTGTVTGTVEWVNVCVRYTTDSQ